MQKTFRFIDKKLFLAVILTMIASNPSKAEGYQEQSLNFSNLAKIQRPVTSVPAQNSANNTNSNIVTEPELADPTIAGRTYNHYDGARVLAPKRKAYPFLDQLEYLLFPTLDFKKENPGQRLERLELATFGEKQKGSIAVRLQNLQSEVDSWQIANMQISENLNSPQSLKNLKPEQAYANPITESVMPQMNYQAPPSYYQNVSARTAPPVVPVQSYVPNYRNRDNNAINMNRIVTPLLNRLGSETINSMFR